MKDATPRPPLPTHSCQFRTDIRVIQEGITRPSLPHREPPAPVDGLSHMSCREVRLDSSARCVAWCLLCFIYSTDVHAAYQSQGCEEAWGLYVGWRAVRHGYVSCRCPRSTLCKGASLQRAETRSPIPFELAGLFCSSIYPVFQCFSYHAWISLLRGPGTL